MKEYIKTYLAPRLQGDGGWVEYVGEEGDRVDLIFRGECSKCLILNRCVDWMEQQIKKDCGREVTINAIQKKPFFWDDK